MRYKWIIFVSWSAIAASMCFKVASDASYERTQRQLIKAYEHYDGTDDPVQDLAPTPELQKYFDEDAHPDEYMYGLKPNHAIIASHKPRLLFPANANRKACDFINYGPGNLFLWAGDHNKGDNEKLELTPLGEYVCDKNAMTADAFWVETDGSTKFYAMER